MVKEFFEQERLSWHRVPSGIQDIDPYYCDLAPSGKAKCFNCRNKILFRTPRIWFRDKINKTIKTKKDDYLTLKNLKVKKIICYKCAPSYLQERYEMLIESKKYLVILIKKFKRSLKGKKTSRRIKSQEILEKLEQETDTDKYIKNASYPHITLK